MLVAATPALAQGRGNGNSAGNSGRGKPPSRSELPTAQALGAPSGTTPFAWIEDATLLEPGALWLGVSAVRWNGSGQSETDVPVIDAALGFSSRVQIGASVPHVVGSTDPTGAAGGLGTTYFNAKILAYKSGAFRVAAAPTLQLLGSSARTSSGDGRARVGVPIDVEYDVSDTLRMYGGSGYFSRSVWFAGGGVAVSFTDRLSGSLSFSRAWVTDPIAPVPHRNEVSGGASYWLNSWCGLFGALGRSLTTLEDPGSTTLTAGLALSMTPQHRRP